MITFYKHLNGMKQKIDIGQINPNFAVYEMNPYKHQLIPLLNMITMSPHTANIFSNLIRCNHWTFFYY